MSMNLKCNKLELWQTPTHISYMCLSNYDGGVAGVAYRYKQWVLYHLNGVWESQRDLEGMRSLVKAHLEDLDKAIKTKNVSFYVT